MAAAVVVERMLPALETALGADRRAKLEAVLLDLAVRWSRAACGGEVTVVHPGEDVAVAVADAFQRRGGPLIVVGGDMPRLGLSHARGALDDMADGADVSFGPALSGAHYLLALREPSARILELAGREWDSPTGVARSLRLARELELDVGLLRMERVLATPADAAAFLSDPLTPPVVRETLAPLTNIR